MRVRRYLKRQGGGLLRIASDRFIPRADNPYFLGAVPTAALAAAYGAHLHWQAMEDRLMVNGSCGCLRPFHHNVVAGQETA